MNSLTDIVLWGGLALLLSCGLLVTLVFAVVFRADEFGKRRARERSRPSSQERAGI